jgi:hypothetical protein
VRAVPRPGERVLDEADAGTGHDVTEGPFDDLAHGVGVHGRRQTHQGQGEGHQPEHDLEGECPCVGEAVGVPEPGERVDEQG